MEKKLKLSFECKQFFLDRIDSKLIFKYKQALLGQRQSYLRKHPTYHESVIIKKLNQINAEYVFQKGFIQGQGFCIVDFYFPRLKIALEIDGEHHYSGLQLKKDQYKTKYLAERKVRVVRIRNKDALEITPQELGALVAINQRTKKRNCSPKSC